MSSATASPNHDSRSAASQAHAKSTRIQNSPPIKLLTLGDSAAGKSSLLLRYTQDSFSEEFISTIGMDFKVKRTEVDGQPVRVQLWDTAGQERFRSITKNYYQGAHGILLVYDLANPNGLKNVQRWARDFADLCQGWSIDRILIGNKLDLLDKKSKSSALEEGKRLSHELGIPFYATSAKTGENVDDTFLSLIRIVHDRLQTQAAEDNGKGKSDARKAQVLGVNQGSKSRSGCCRMG